MQIWTSSNRNMEKVEGMKISNSRGFCIGKRVSLTQCIKSFDISPQRERKFYSCIRFLSMSIVCSILLDKISTVSCLLDRILVSYVF